ncbi:hypothetical protein D3Z58_25215 [Clostridiaceae bacterium]|nr:hypothetical protein [Clostridiaceae bacterium]
MDVKLMVQTVKILFMKESTEGIAAGQIMAICQSITTSQSPIITSQQSIVSQQSNAMLSQTEKNCFRND